MISEYCVYPGFMVVLQLKRISRFPAVTNQMLHYQLYADSVAYSCIKMENPIQMPESILVY